MFGAELSRSQDVVLTSPISLEHGGMPSLALSSCVTLAKALALSEPNVDLMLSLQRRKDT